MNNTIQLIYITLNFSSFQVQEVREQYCYLLDLKLLAFLIFPKAAHLFSRLDCHWQLNFPKIQHYK